MKRARRQTLRRGNLGALQRKRLRARLAQVRRGWGPLTFARPGHPGIREARRLAESRLVAAVQTKCRRWG